MTTIPLDQLRQRLDARFSERRMRAVAATALSRTAAAMAKKWQDNINTKVDRPTPRTQKAVRYTQATAKSLEAVVQVQGQGETGRPNSYLAPIEHGGQRGQTKFEQTLARAGILPGGWHIVPGRAAQRDRYGNVSQAVYKGVLRDVAAGHLDKGYQQATSRDAGRRAAASKRHGATYIAVRKADKGGISPGIYTRDKSGRAHAVFIFKQSVSYSKIISLRQQAEGASLRGVVAEELEKAIKEHEAKI